MSETIRSYSSGGAGVYGAPGSRGRTFRRVMLVMLAAGAVWIFWTTRDTWPAEALVPGEQTYRIQAARLLASRQDAAGSPLWRLGVLPERYHAVPELLGNNFGLPDWVLNNLVSGTCYISGKDTLAFSDVLVVTRMSRIGCLIERYHRYFGGPEVDYAGGLELRRMPESGVYYAVRGRTLVFSPARDALIAALTLPLDESLARREDRDGSAAGDLHGTVAPRESDPLGAYIERADFALAFAPGMVRFYAEARMRAAWRAPLDAIGSGGSSGPLSAPSNGGVVVAGDLGAPLPAVWRAVDEMAGGWLSGTTATWPGFAPGEGEAGERFREALQEAMGPGFTLRWTGVDVDGVLPLPELDVWLETRADAAAWLEAIPAIGPDATPLADAPYRNPDRGVVHWPQGWGSVFEPALAPVPGGVRLALHAAHLEQIPAAGPPVAVSSDLYIRIRPSEALALIQEAGMVYAECGLIRGHSLASFQTTMDGLMAGTREVSEVRIAAGYRDGAVRLEAEIELRPGG
ncbi:MAG: hypothetical protein KF886_25605 [Candidatus Hydrogenedentes bacterium]|nr:hypothetical protein [Candidatus Hydrogenedentota bacterium]